MHDRTCTMSRTNISVAPYTPNANSFWISKLTCRRHNEIDGIEIEENIHTLNESIEITYPLIFENVQQSKKNAKSRAWCKLQSNQGVSTNGISSDSTIENDSSVTSGHIDNNIINREFLSSSVELLHEVHTKRWPSVTGVYFVPNYQYSYEEEWHGIDDSHHRNDCDDTCITSKENKQNKVNLIDTQKERMVIRQRLRYDAIQKDLLYSLQHSFNETKAMESDESDLKRHGNITPNHTMDSVGCQTVALWNAFPYLSSHFLSSLPVNDTSNHNSDDERDSDELSCTVGTIDDDSLISDETETTNSGYDSEETFRFFYRKGNSDVSFRIKSENDASCVNSLIEQSLEAGNDKCKTYQRNIVSDLTVEQFVDSSNMVKQHFEKENLSVTNCKSGEFIGKSNTAFPVFGCTSDCKDTPHEYKNLHQKHWLVFIEERFNENGLKRTIEEKQKRRDAAKAALKRIQKISSRQSFFVPSVKAHDFWG